MEKWDDVKSFLIINLKGNPESISMRIIDCFPRVTRESFWKDLSFDGYDIIDDILVWNDEMISEVDLNKKLTSDLQAALKLCLIKETRNTKIDSLGNI
jgi:Tfp pilus assembly ATPase PilU